MSTTEPTPIDEECTNGGVKWNKLLGYLGAAEYDQDTILPEIANAVNEASGKWNIFTREFTDHLQCGKREYRIDEAALSNRGLYADDVLFVSAAGICFTEAENDCGFVCNTYEYDEESGLITLAEPPMADVRNGLKVRIRLNMYVNEACCLPERFVKKYGVHIINYMLYKRSLRQTGERLTSTQARLLAEDAVEFFERNEWKPYKGIKIEAIAEKRVRLC